MGALAKQGKSTAIMKARKLFTTIHLLEHKLWLKAKFNICIHMLKIHYTLAAKTKYGLILIRSSIRKRAHGPKSLWFWCTTLTNIEHSWFLLNNLSTYWTIVHKMQKWLILNRIAVSASNIPFPVCSSSFMKHPEEAHVTVVQLHVVLRADMANSLTTCAGIL